MLLRYLTGTAWLLLRAEGGVTDRICRPKTGCRSCLGDHLSDPVEHPGPAPALRLGPLCLQDLTDDKARKADGTPMLSRFDARPQDFQEAGQPGGMRGPGGSCSFSGNRIVRGSAAIPGRNGYRCSVPGNPIASLSGTVLGYVRPSWASRPTVQFSPSPAGCVQVCASRANRFAARGLGPSKSSEGQYLYYLLEWLDPEGADS